MIRLQELPLLPHLPHPLAALPRLRQDPRHRAAKSGGAVRHAGGAHGARAADYEDQEQGRLRADVRGRRGPEREAAYLDGRGEAEDEGGDSAGGESGGDGGAGEGFRRGEDTEVCAGGAGSDGDVKRRWFRSMEGVREVEG